MHRSVLSAADAVSGTLFFMVADNGTDSGERVILEEHLPGLQEPVLLKELDHNGDRSMDRTALLTHGLFAVEAAVCLGDNMDRHAFSPFLSFLQQYLCTNAEVLLPNTVY
jgi:hypothetical protein